MRKKINKDPLHDIDEDHLKENLTLKNNKMKKTSEKKYHKVIGHNGKVALINEAVHTAFGKAAKRKEEIKSDEDLDIPSSGKKRTSK